MKPLLYTPADFPRGMTLDQLIGWVVGRGFSSSARSDFQSKVERLNSLTFTPAQHAALFIDIEDEAAAQALEDLADLELERQQALDQFKMIGAKWEFVGGAAPRPPLTVLKTYGVAPGTPPRAEYPATRTVQPAASRPPSRPPASVYPP